MSQQPDFRGRTVVITGVTSGAGRAAALAFAHTGATLVLAARREEALRELAGECTLISGTEAYPVPTDVTDAAAVKALANAAVAATGKIDVWINNAGVLAAGPLEDTPVEVHERVLQTNLMGYIHGAHAVVPVFKAQGYGTLINNISIGGFVAVPYAVAYSASKYGLRGMNDALRSELSGWPQIHVCAMYPAFLDTPGIQHAANYTGVLLKPAPPVFDPQQIALAMVKLVAHPQAVTWCDGAAPMLRIGYGLMPKLAGRIARWAMDAYFKSAGPVAPSSGNLFDTNTPLTTVHGGWKPIQQKALLAAGFIVAGLAGLVLLGRSRK